jgi:sec-independent protein translocase protein TatC
MAMAPLLFMAGMAFGYFVVLPRAVGFLQNFNASSFDALVQARTYYRFILAVIGLTRTGIVSTRQCASTAATPSLPSPHWRCCYPAPRW